MDEHAPELVDVMQRALELSNVSPGERVVMLTTHKYNRDSSRYYEAFRVALNRLGTESVTIELPPQAMGMRREDPLGPFASQLLEQADVVVRSILTPFCMPTPEPDMYNPQFSRILSSGTRWIDFMLDEASLWRLFPTPEMIERTRLGAARIQAANTIRIASAAGTDLTVCKTGRKGNAQDGIAPVPGSWDNFGFGKVGCAPLEDSAEGTLVISPGDAAGYPGGTAVGRSAFDREHTTYRFEDGRIVSIEGGEAATQLRAHLESFGNPDVYRIAHMGWGTQDHAVWGARGVFTLADWECYYGSVLVHFGSNSYDSPVPHCGLGGRIPPGTYHWGGTMLNHSLWLDGELIIDEGRIVPLELR